MLIAEEPGPVKDDAVVVQEIKQRFFIANATHFVANAVKFRSLQQTMLAFGRFALLVLFEHLLAAGHAPLSVLRRLEEADADRSDRAQLL